MQVLKRDRIRSVLNLTRQSVGVLVKARWPLEASTDRASNDLANIRHRLDTVRHMRCDESLIHVRYLGVMQQRGL